MISLEKLKILTPIQKLANNVGDLGKIIVATSFEWLPKVQKYAKSGHTVLRCQHILALFYSYLNSYSVQQVPNSVTISWNKKQPKCLKKLFHKYPQQFLRKSEVFQKKPPKFANNLNFYYYKFCGQELSKIAQSVHTSTQSGRKWGQLHLSVEWNKRLRERLILVKRQCPCFCNDTLLSTLPKIW